MKLLIQRVSEASVKVDEQIVGSIKKGLLVFLGVATTDTEAEIEWLVNKLINLRIFYDSDGKMNLSLLESVGEVLLVSQFTLYGDCTKGRRPSFIQAAGPELALKLYESFIKQLKAKKIKTETGIFGADMKVALINDGPVTMILQK